MISETAFELAVEEVPKHSGCFHFLGLFEFCRPLARRYSASSADAFFRR